MDNYKNIKNSLEEGILTITINRDEKLNALNAQTITELKLCIENSYDDKRVKGLIITGSGDKAFVAGADISEFINLDEINGRKYAEQGQEVFALIENCPKPIIAVVNGYALGGGCELAMACHMRVASKNAFFGLPEVSLGILPAFGGTQRLTQIVGKAKALEMMLTGEMIDASAAYSTGLANHLGTTNEDAMELAKAILNKIFNNAPLSIAKIINSVNASFSKVEDGYQIEVKSFANCCNSLDFKEGTAAFLEKRKPKFKGE